MDIHAQKPMVEASVASSTCANPPVRSVVDGAAEVVGAVIRLPFDNGDRSLRRRRWLYLEPEKTRIGRFP
ncbi:hypothetical protein GCM10025863_30950 [Microbacterium suwonense]|uniref:Uncharacterized protein n=1 Tax=Microbacterium suwonense TaxID=683047 RepID=A0ABM8FXW3_9MICO|nr:hypothetical protein GCM10025863_30950 [Microbacterium suwonense]